MKKILFISFLAFTMFSCKKDDTLRYHNITMGNIDGQTIISDQGNTFDIAEAPVEIDLSAFEYGRVLVVCDVLKETSQNRYDIRLNGISSVLTKPVELESHITNPELKVEDAINIREIWYAGGYLNMLIEIAQKKGSKTEHRITLVLDDSAEGYTFVLRHNAYNEVPTEEDLEYSGSMGYVSFPIASLIKEDAATITMKWKSHKFLYNGSYSLLETEDIIREFKWERRGHEHDMPTARQSSSFRAR